jgi:hypothetical protein
MLDGDCGQDRVHDKRANGLAVAYKTTQDIPVPLSRLENAGGWLGKPGGNRRFGLGGRKRPLKHPRICGYSQKGPQCEPSEADEIGAREHIFEPDSAFLVLLGPGMISIGAAGSRRRESTVKRALHMLDELRDVVQRKPWLEVAKIAGRYFEALSWRGDAPAGQPPAQCFVDDIAERPAGAARFGPELGCHILIQGEGRSHVLMLWSRYHDVN